MVGPSVTDVRTRAQRDRGEGSGRSSEQVGKGYREKKIDKRDKTMRTSATVSIDGRREETKPIQWVVRRRKEEERVSEVRVRWSER